MVVHAAMDGADTVKRLLSFGRPSQEGPAAPLDNGVLLREVATLTAPRWRDAAQQQGRPISMLVEVSGDTTVLGWAPLLREALTNLIFNAVDALHRGRHDSAGGPARGRPGDRRHQRHRRRHSA